MSGATITIGPLIAEVTTDVNGYYEKRNLGSGTYKIEGSSPVYVLYPPSHNVRLNSSNGNAYNKDFTAIEPPQADFTASPTAGVAPLEVTFTNTSTGDIWSYLWDFGDGSTSTDTNPPPHTYGPGRYEATLKVTGPDLLDYIPGAERTSVSAPTTINVNAPPVARIKINDTEVDTIVVNEGTTVTLNGQESYDPEYPSPSYPNNGIISYNWSYAWKTISGPDITFTPVPPYTDDSLMEFIVPEGITDTGPIELEITLIITDNQSSPGDKTVTVTINRQPVAHAGLDKIVNEGELVELDGSASDDPDGTIQSYHWEQIAGLPLVTLEGADEVQASFTAPDIVETPERVRLTFRLTVKDNNNFEHSDEVEITINQQPVAHAGENRIVNEGELVELDGSGSYDPDGTIESYQWVQVDNGSPTVILEGNNTEQASFTAPDVDDPPPITLIFRLTVKDDDNFEDLDEVRITINQKPVAHAGLDQIVNEGELVELDGSASDDPDGTIQSYHWEQIAGFPLVTLEGDDAVQASFTAPEDIIGAAPITLTFQLTVKDNNNFEDFDEVAITINRRPSANAGLDQRVNEGDLVQSDGSDSYDPDEGTLSYEWVQEYAPPGVELDIIDSDKVQARFEAPIGVNYRDRFDIILKLTVTDTNNLSCEDTVLVTVNRHPVSEAGNVQVVKEDDLVQLDGAASYDLDDLGGTYQGITSFSWQVIEPLPSPVTLTNPLTATPSFIAPASSDGPVIVVELTVTGDGGLTHTDTVEIIINEPPVAEAGDPQTVREDTLVTLDGTSSYDPDNSTEPQNGIRFWKWEQEGGPPITLEDEDTANPTFTAPKGVIGAGVVNVTFRLTVTDNRGFSSSDTVTITINRHPIADAGEAQTVNEGTENVTLDGRNSYDPDHPDPIYPDNGIQSYSWVQILGPDVINLQGEATATPTFTAPEVVTDQDVTFELTVWDEHDLRNININTNTVIITVKHAANILYVAQDGSGDYTTIEEAIEHVVADPLHSIDVIEVKPGTYQENIDMTDITHPVTLRSETWHNAKQASSIRLSQDTIIQGIVTMSNDSELLGFKIEDTSGATRVILDSVSKAIVAYNTIKAEKDVGEKGILSALEVINPLMAGVDDDISIHNNVIITRAYGTKCEARGLAIWQNEGSTTLIENQKIHILNNTIDVISEGYAKALYVNANNLYESGNQDLYTLGIVVRNNITVIEAWEVDGQEGRSFCIFKISPNPPQDLYLPVRYNYLYTRAKTFFPNGTTHNSNVYIDNGLIGTERNIIGNWEFPPLYRDLAGEDFRLLEDSICIDAGCPDDGGPIDGDCDDSAVVDMGAYEFNYAYMGDLDYSCSVDFFDFSIFGRAWMTQQGDPDWDWACDISDPPDDYIDWRDLAILCDNWLAQIP